MGFLGEGCMVFLFPRLTAASLRFEIVFLGASIELLEDAVSHCRDLGAAPRDLENFC